MSDFPYPDKPVSYIDSRAAEQWVWRALTDRHGPAALVHRRLRSVVTGLPLGIGVWCPADPVAAMVAAQQMFGAARTLMRRWAADARAAGRTWDDLAAALRLHRDDGDTPALAAFDYLAPDTGYRHDDRALTWRCHSCAQLVTDRAPYGHPADNQDGHHPDCPRHHTDITTWQAQPTHHPDPDPAADDRGRQQ